MNKEHFEISLFVISILGLILSSCSKYIDPDPSKSKLLIVKVDYSKPEFEGGVEMLLPRLLQNGNSMPLKGTFDQTWDFAHMIYTYIPTGDTVFYGGVFWMGKGEITIPKSFSRPQSFQNELFSAPQPIGLDNIQESESYSSVKDTILPVIWSKIGTLSRVKYYMANNAHVSLYLYAPTVGMFDPTVAKWIVFLYLN